MRYWNVPKEVDHGRPPEWRVRMDALRRRLVEGEDPEPINRAIRMMLAEPKLDGTVRIFTNKDNPKDSIMTTDSRPKWTAVHWDGKKIEGGPPAWMKAGVNRGPMTPLGICRVHDQVHVFDKNGAVVGVAKPNEWILYCVTEPELRVATQGDMEREWEFKGAWFYERPEEITSRAGTGTDIRNGARSVLEGWVVVTETTHPKLHDAFETISHDCGAGAGHVSYSVPPEWAQKLDLVESGLAMLKKDELETLAIGDETEQLALCARSLPLQEAHAMLNAFFEDWEVTDAG